MTKLQPPRINLLFRQSNQTPFPTTHFNVQAVLSSPPTTLVSFSCACTNYHQPVGLSSSLPSSRSFSSFKFLPLFPPLRRSFHFNPSSSHSLSLSYSLASFRPFFSSLYFVSLGCTTTTYDTPFRSLVTRQFAVPASSSLASLFFFFFLLLSFLFRLVSLSIPKGHFFLGARSRGTHGFAGCLASRHSSFHGRTVTEKEKKAQPLFASIWLLPLRLLGWITQYYIPPNPAFLLFPVVWFLKVSYPPAAPSYRGFLKLVWIYGPESLGLSFFLFSCEGALVSLLAVGCLRVRLVFGFTFERCHFLHLSICASVIFPRHPSNTPTLRPPCSFPPPSSKSSATFLPRLLAWCSFTHPSASSTPRNSGSKLCERAVANGLWFFFRLHSVTGGGFGERRQQHLLGHNLVNGSDSMSKNGKGIIVKARGEAGAKITDKGKKSDMAGDPASKRDYRDDVRYV